jgi:hypothetical protein
LPAVSRPKAPQTMKATDSAASSSLAYSNSGSGVGAVEVDERVRESNSTLKNKACCPQQRPAMHDESAHIVEQRHSRGLGTGRSSVASGPT